jgi:hypothetical protein
MRPRVPDELPEEKTPRAPLKQPAPVSSTFVARGMFAHRPGEDEKAAPTPVERPQTCRCGREFTQSFMAPSELEALERMGHIDTFMRQIPGGWVPVHCPKCERGQLTLQKQLDDARRLSAASGADRRVSA